MHYVDLSPQASYLEAINCLYDVLRWAETREDAKTVLIHNIIEQIDNKDGSGCEHKEALFDRVFRATSGNKI